MDAAPCGILCAICRLYLNGRCKNCAADRAAKECCPVAECAAGRGVVYCPRDCPDYPCSLLYGEFAFRRTWLETAPGAGERQNRAVPEVGLQFYCLGTFRVSLAGEELGSQSWGSGKGPTRKIKAMLAFLLHRGGRGARQETLIELLWPRQTDPKRAGISFHQALHHLRRALEPELAAREQSSYVRRRGEHYIFEPLKPCWVDAWAFAGHIRRARALEQSGEPADAAEQWRLAIDLYGGDYMAGIDTCYTEHDLYQWCAPERQELQAQYLEGLMALARQSLARHEHERLLGYARKALRVDPALEQAHRIIIQSLEACGRGAAAAHRRHHLQGLLARDDSGLPSG